ncbi:MAG: hypothetical protein M3256_24210 [Actinomycetota bacterium]|nr:hypothetical protein [Actinomycetota bacterium]
MISTSVGRWRIDRWRGGAGDAHGEPWPSTPAPAARLVAASRSALVLGSTQALDVVDVAAAESREVSVVRRRSGGGAVLVGTGDVVWVDVFVPAGDAMWHRDVGRATHWLGQVWVDAASSLGAEADWHDGPLLSGPWSSLVCFAGLGPGEVRVAGAKIVGISQRRTRAGTLFQCAALTRWNPGSILGILRLDGAERARAERDLAGVAVGMAAIAADIEDAFVHRLSSV